MAKTTGPVLKRASYVPKRDVIALELSTGALVEILRFAILGGQLKSHTWGHLKTAHYPVGTSKSHT